MSEPLPPASARWSIPAVAAVATAVLHVVTASTPGFGLFRDELYFLACGQHLAAGYVDQPPFIALVARRLHLWLARGLRTPISELWPTLKQII